MTDRKQALIDLRDKVKAGECYPKDILSVFPHYVGDCGQWAHDAYFHGSLDAAKALHEAVLPGFDAEVAFAKPSLVTIYQPFDDEWEEISRAESENPARAWLLAILEALIAQEEQSQ